MAPSEEEDKEYLREWKYDIYKLRQGSGYISGSFWLGTNGTEVFKSSMMLERLFNLVTAAMLVENDAGDMPEMFPDAIVAARHKIANYQEEDPERSDEHYHKKTRVRSFQRDIVYHMEEELEASQIMGK